MQTEPTAEGKTVIPRFMRRWKCHKIVEAEKITGIEPQVVHNSHPLILGEGPDAPRFVVTDEFRSKHNPKVGDYLVRYADGYVSVSPAKAFEEGYTLMPADYRERVRQEKSDLDDNIDRLELFLNKSSPQVNCPPQVLITVGEHQRMTLQLAAMRLYSEMLGQRIANFEQ